MPFSLFRAIAVRRTRLLATEACSTRTFCTAPLVRSAVKPGSESEATTPGAGSTEEIANSQGAYDGSRTNPESSTSKIESETHANFDSSSANKEASDMATKAQHQSDRRPSKQEQSQPDTSHFGASGATQKARDVQQSK
ncbi:uncharacterized protein UMAG_02080 [Mycosarcoma maydis]|uniref:Uncharacterized protein n=1 Tax=Mycosarcoma maydis TaxID=5270 RepID=A0A0D1C7S2_MYCMD|nr:uncharacterized protein UMAG_02080 [Ustilago maydis 521]KIS69542.1 hypothetical protein UMAG_02080 [Ustilago maydis 521]|eukprot:XP_011388454.1 hypothetical protein UMAG_02080 [Ustilago maydis 521]